MTAYQEKIKTALMNGALLQCTEGKNYKTWLVYPNGTIEIVRRDSAEKVCELCFGSLVFGEPNGIRWYKKYEEQLRIAEQLENEIDNL